jgi:uncharacterized membrane protein
VVRTLPIDTGPVEAAIAAARRSVAVDIHLVTVEAASRYGAFALIHSLVAALVAGFVPAVAFPDLPVRFVVALQFILGLAALAATQNRWLRQELVPKASMRKAALRHARLTYAHLKLRTRHDRPLLLLYVARFERQVEILAEERILDHVPETVWAELVAAFMPEMRMGRTAAAYARLVADSAAALQPFFPADMGTRAGS